MCSCSPQWFCGQGISEGECANLLVGTALVQGIEGDRESRACKAISAGYEKIY